jgi:hypothetical protein
MYARDSTYVVETEKGNDGSALNDAVITIVWALTLTFSLFAVLGAVALFVVL